MSSPEKPEESAIRLLPGLLTIMLALGLGGGIFNLQNAELTQENSEVITEEPAASTPEPTETPTEESESSSEPSTSTPALSDDLEAALFDAEFYFTENYYCRAELIRLLESEGYTTNAATYGVDSLGANWLEEAYGAAYVLYYSQDYTYEETIDTLYALGCTQEEVDYAVSGL
jgi:hypothetical protein